MKRRCLALVVALAAPAAAQEATRDEGVIDVESARAPAASFDTLWAEYTRAEQAGDADGAARVFEDIRRLRVERNIRSLDGVGLALVARGLEHEAAGDREAATLAFERAAIVDPHLPDAPLALASLKGPLAVEPLLKGLTARWRSSMGRRDFLHFALGVGLLAALATAFVLATVLLVKTGALLRHDLEEALGPERPRVVALGVYVLLLLLPVVSVQGWGWLPLWWMALLFVYLGNAHRVLAGIAVAVSVAVGPVVAAFEPELVGGQNRLLRASLGALEGGPDAVLEARLEAAILQTPDDRDLRYLLGLHYKKAGRYDQAVELYRRMLEQDPKDPVALNNFANIEFVRGDFMAAAARYRQAAEAGGPPRHTATAYYNLSLAQLQRFEFEPAKETRASADALAGSLTAEYERMWQFEQEGNVVPAVADLGPTPGEVWSKFASAQEGSGTPNVTGRGGAGVDSAAIASGMLSRFTGFLAVIVIAFLTLSRWRGSRMFTLRCLKCGTPFCKLCHLGTPSNELCTQCHHLFVVRDGVSAPARQRKLLEVHAEEGRRRRVFRILSLVSPGAGHLYAGKYVLGLGLCLVWYVVLAALALSGRVVPLTLASEAVASSAPTLLAVVGLLALFAAAQLLTPSFEIPLSLPRRPLRRSPRVA